MSTVAPGLGREFDDALFAGLAVDPAGRPDALGFGAALAAALGRWTRSGRPGVVGGPAGRDCHGEDERGPGPRGDDRPRDPGGRHGVLDLDPAAARPHGPRDSRRRSPGASADRSSGWPLTLLTIVAAVLVLGLIGSRLLSAGPTSSGDPRAERRRRGRSPSARRPAQSRPRASCRRRRRRPSDTAAPTPDPAVRALDDLDAAIAAARGGHDGLKGKDANDLAARVAVVRRDLDAGDRAKALRDARELDQRVRDRGQGARRRGRATG